MDKKLVLVLGMHRSGTSLAAGILCKCGIDFGDNLMPATDDNPKGYFEDLDFVNINNTILRKYKSSWYDHEPIKFNFFRFIRYYKYLSMIRTKLGEKFSGKTIFGVKDPRISRLLPVWEKFSEPYDKKYIVVFRSPFEVAESLRKRDGFSLEKSIKIWIAYNKSIIDFVDSNDSVFFSYGKIVSNTKMFIDKVFENLNIDMNVSTIDDFGFVDKGLYRNKIEDNFDNIKDAGLKKNCFDIYQRLISLEEKTNIS
ncbi:sulfotransferase family protein [Geothermobacter hydrogeniphilus]|uniref:Sulfotransferase family protein n=1 Tax=Geothermobacter hydrogeniphilus TaxID=1969733 RepID=A0A1X0Y1S2_9BACT|nr:hypothetical protein [Geothermobacter hydrogeniphilus]ORJ59038.1 hypothetical protein B5V00_10725 [Geothermobacter hydrogeniphilus]